MLIGSVRVLRDIFETGTVVDASGAPVPARENVVAAYAEALYRAVLDQAPGRVLEVGMAYGVTSLAILAALEELGSGELVSVDPFQSSDWRGIGVLNVERAGFAGRHRVIEEFDYLALPRLLEDGAKFDLAYIDGWHNFEYVLLDFFYADKMLAPGAIVGFNDCDWLPVRSVLRFVAKHRDYEPIDVGLPALYGDRRPWSRTLRRIDRQLTRGRITESRVVGPLLGRRREDRYFRKTGDAERPHGFWASL
jgi:predicted O-methyltransferase YrrM